MDGDDDDDEVACDDSSDNTGDVGVDVVASPLSTAEKSLSPFLLAAATGDSDRNLRVMTTCADAFLATADLAVGSAAESGIRLDLILIWLSVFTLKPLSRF